MTERAYIYLQGEISGSFAVFVWHIRQTLDPTEIRLRLSRSCCPTTPGDTCCVSRPFKLQAEPSGAMAAGIGMLRSWSKLTVEPAREKDTHYAVHMHDPPRTRAYLHPIHCTAPAGFKRLFSIRTDRKSDNSSRQWLPTRKLLWSFYPIIVSHTSEFSETKTRFYPKVNSHMFRLTKKTLKRKNVHAEGR